MRHPSFEDKLASLILAVPGNRALTAVLRVALDDKPRNEKRRTIGSRYHAILDTFMDRRALNKLRTLAANLGVAL